MSLESVGRANRDGGKGFFSVGSCSACLVMTVIIAGIAIPNLLESRK